MANDPTKSDVVYRIKAKRAGDWFYIKDRNNIPITITTSKAQNSVPYLFQHRYPSIGDVYIPGETLIAEPDMEATKRLAEFKKQREEEENERIQGMWWNK